MRKAVHAVLLAVCLALPVAAQEEPIRNTIQSQIEAFQADDFARAFTFASPDDQGDVRHAREFRDDGEAGLSDGLPACRGCR